MDYSKITQELIEKRFDILPEKVRTVLDSEKNREQTQKICAENFLSEEQIEITEQLTTLILLGFASPKEFQNELIDKAGLTDENAAKIASTIKEKILAEAGSDLGRVYSPLVEPTANEIKEEATKESVAIRMPIDAVAAPKIASPSESAAAVTAEPAPFVLYEDKQKTQAPEIRKPLNRPFSFSFNLFKPQNTASPKSEVQARIETTGDPEGKEEPKSVKVTLPRRTVHYSEFRSPVSPFGGNNITNLEKPEPAHPEMPPAPNFPPPAPTEEKNDSVIDLRNL